MRLTKCHLGFRLSNCLLESAHSLCAKGGMSRVEWTKRNATHGSISIDLALLKLSWDVSTGMLKKSGFTCEQTACQDADKQNVYAFASKRGTKVLLYRAIVL